MGHGVKFWHNTLDTPGHCNTFWAQGTARCLHCIVLFLKPIYTGHFACHKHCGCTIVYIIRRGILQVLPDVISVHSTRPLASVEVVHICCGKLHEGDYTNERWLLTACTLAQHYLKRHGVCNNEELYWGEAERAPHVGLGEVLPQYFGHRVCNTCSRHIHGIHFANAIYTMIHFASHKL